MNDQARAQAGTLTIRWLGQAGFVLSAGGARVAVDLWLSAHPLRARPAPDVGDIPDGTRWLLATHEHADHLDLGALPRLLDRFPDLGIVVPEPLRPRVMAAVPGARVHGVQPGERLDLGVAQLSVVHAWHGVVAADGYSDGHALRADGLTPFVGYVLAFGSVTAYHAGDTILGTGLIDELRPHGVHVALLPVNGRDDARERAGILGNLDAVEAVTLATAIGARVLVPMHHDMVRGNRARAARVVDAASRTAAPLALLLPARATDVEVGPATSPSPQRSEAR
jgi:L-ascorbate metabolism protein UlaG (beta-lactamase superfamily)